MAELLLELLSEEIPARMQARAAADLQRLVTDGLTAAGLKFGEARAYATPRRLALVVEGLPKKQADRRDERKGPRVGAPDQALAGFLKANGLDSIEACERRRVGKAEFYFLTMERPGQATALVLADILTAALAALPWPKSMRWGAGPTRWVRPLQGIVCLFAGKVLDFSYGGVMASHSTCGHRFLAPTPFQVSGFESYRAGLHAAYVILDAAERRATILAEATRAATAEGLSLRPDEGLLDEVSGLVEWPVVLCGRIDEAFMDVPPEVLTTSMRSHQKYFSLHGPDGQLAPRFLVVANMAAADGGAAILVGNERVLRARLSDARFFWDQDRKRSLESRVPALAEVIFHARLGSLAAKTERIGALAATLATHVPGAEIDPVRSAATLCKADLTSGMVGEFPELQGVMGRYYALEEGERPEVAAAIADHYGPLGPNDSCPTAPVSVAVALADKIDSLVGFFAIDERPTGSKDPYALRRAALGVIRLIVENDLRLPLAAILAEAGRLYGDIGAALDTGQLLDFFADRLKVHLRGRGMRHDLIAAVFALGGEDDLVRLLARVAALDAFLASDDGANLLVAYKRAGNIVVAETKKGWRDDGAPHDAARFEQDEERRLGAALTATGAAVTAALAGEDFTAAMTALAALRAPVDDFFDQVTVNSEDGGLRANRLKLLDEIRTIMGGVADFSQIEAGSGT